MYFSLSFFDIMVHLITHLVREIRICIPMFLRWMYPNEPCMKMLKGYMRIHIEHKYLWLRYIVEEAIEFCTTYMSETDAIGVPRSRYEGRHDGKGTRGVRVIQKHQN